MTPVGILFLITLFIIVILGVIIIGQAETIKDQKQAINILNEMNSNFNKEAREFLRLTKAHTNLLAERDALRRTLEDLR